MGENDGMTERRAGGCSDGGEGQKDMTVKGIQGSDLTCKKEICVVTQ